MDFDKSISKKFTVWNIILGWGPNAETRIHTNYLSIGIENFFLKGSKL